MEHPYPGELPINLEQEQKSRQEVLAKLGGEFSVCWDVWQQDQSLENFSGPLLKDGKFNDKVFFEAASKLEKGAGQNPAYLNYIQRFIREVMDEISEKNLTLEQRNKEMSDLAVKFIARVEFFSRLNAPEQITSGGKTAKQLEAGLRRENIQISAYAQQMLRNKKEFFTSKEPEQIDLVRLKVNDLFNNDNQNHTVKDIYEKAQELGLELCPAEVGPAYRLAYTPNGQLKKEQPLNEWISVAMKQISDPDGDSNVFEVACPEDGFWLVSSWADPDNQWGPESEIVFRLPVSASKT